MISNYLNSNCSNLEYLRGENDKVSKRDLKREERASNEIREIGIANEKKKQKIQFKRLKLKSSSIIKLKQIKLSSEREKKGTQKLRKIIGDNFIRLFSVLLMIIDGDDEDDDDDDPSSLNTVMIEPDDDIKLFLISAS